MPPKVTEAMADTPLPARDAAAGAGADMAALTAADAGGEEDPEEDDGFCGVCGSPHSEEGDALLFCDGKGCGVAVHQLCYAVAEVPPGDEPWSTSIDLWT